MKIRILSGHLCFSRAIVNPQNAVLVQQGVSMKKYGLLLVVFLGALTVFAACNKPGEGTKMPDLSLLGPSSVGRTTVLPAGDTDCPNGGIRMDTGIDSNNNGVLEADEVKNTSNLCNDQKVTENPYEHSSLVAIESEPTGTVHCPAGGLKIRSGTDANNNGMLDPGEDAYTEYICNGKPGASSAAGIMMAAGRSGGLFSQGQCKEDGRKSSAPGTAKAAAGESARPAKKADAKVKSPAPAAATAAADESAGPSKKANAKVKQPAPATAKAAPKGWTDVGVNSSVGKAAYKIDGRYIIVHFQNTSATSTARFKYTVTWKEGQNGKWVDESTVQGIGIHLKPLEELDREIRTYGQEIKDVVVELEISEVAGGS